MTNNVSLQLEAVGGLAAGIVGTVIGYPLDLVKTRMQTSSSSSSSTSSSSSSSSSSPSSSTRVQSGMERRNLLRVGADIVRTEGISALYRGMTPPLLSLSVLNTMNFTSYSYLRSWYQADRGWDVRNGYAGWCVGPLAGMVSTAEHMVKTQMQLDNVTDRRYRNSWHCLTTLVRSYGPTILYTGHVVNTMRESIFLASYFYTYEGLRDYLHKTSHVSSLVSSSSVSVPLAGGLSGALAWFVSFPFDCVKAGVQGQRMAPVVTSGVVHANVNAVATKSIIRSGSGGGGEVPMATPRQQQPPPRRLGAVDVFKKLLETKGLRGLYSGVTPSIARAFLVSGSRFSAYEFVVWAMGGKHWQD